MNPRFFMRAASVAIAVFTLAACQLSSAQAAVRGGFPKLTPVVKTSAQFCATGSAGKQTLCGLGIHVSEAGGSSSFVKCLSCGPGRWADWSEAGTGWVAKGASPISSHASVLLVVTKPGYVGRYSVYRPAAANTPQARLKLVGAGCIAANITAAAISKGLQGRLHNLPTIPCKAPKVKGLLLATAGLSELSHSISHALIYGTAPQKMWLTIAQTTTANCKAGPLAYSAAERHSRIWYTWQVKGRFAEGFETHALLPQGRFCIYMQTGAQYHGFADGWIAAGTYYDYDTGDTLTGPAATALTAPGATTVTLSGDAPRAEILQSYDSLTPCPEFSELVQYTGFGGSTMQVSGQFTDTLNTASFAQSGYICSYLNDGGFTVAMSTDQVTVAGTQFKDQPSYAETADEGVSTVSNPIGNGGTAGATIAAGQTVQVRCIVNGSGLAPYDPVWYEVSSTPWGDAYYAPAYAFYNNGQTSGAVVNGKRWDLAVPSCTTLTLAGLT
jgi:hypothetical protein